MSKPYSPHFIVDENQLTIYPSRPMIEQWLTFSEKQLVQDEETFDRKTTSRRVQAFWVIEERPEGNVIGTLQGLWKFLLLKCLAKGWAPRMEDTRLGFPEPRLDKVHGLYDLQDWLLRTGLKQNWSGIFSAPTRSGKSYIMANILRAYPDLKTAVLVPGEDLGVQLFEDLQRLVKRDFKLMGFGSRVKHQGDDVTVCSYDSMDKLDADDTKLLLIDEIQDLPTGDIPWEPSQGLPTIGEDGSVEAVENSGRLAKVLQFQRARKYGFSATISGRFDNRDMLIEGVVGPVLAEVTYPQAVEAGIVAPIKCLLCHVPYNTEHVNPRRRAWVYEKVLWRSDYMGRLVKAMCENVIPPDWQTLMFIQDEKTALHFQKYFEQPPIAMAKRMTKKQRTALMSKMARNEVSRCLASNIYSKGVTFKDLRVVINLAGGGASTNAVQRPGRVSQVRPGKRCGVLIDFVFDGFGRGEGKAWAPDSESKARAKLYAEKGYEVIHIGGDLADFPHQFQNHCV